MDMQTFTYHREAGWGLEHFPAVDSDRTLVLIFGASSFLQNPQPIEELVKAYPTSVIAGCSTSGEIFGTEISDDSLAVAVVSFDSSRLKLATTEVKETSGSRAAGQQLSEALMADDLRGVLVLSDGLSVNGSELVQGINSILPDNIVVTGGLAGDGDRFERTWIIRDGRPMGGVVSAVGIYGDAVRIGHGSMGGWDIFGPERCVTHSEGNVLYELDGQPALELYKRYLGDLADGLPATALRFPLALRDGDDEAKSVVRTILAINEDEQSMTFAGDVPEGARAQLMRANFDRLIDGAAGAAMLTRESCPDQLGPVLAIAISCVGRRLVLGEATEEEIESTIDALPEGTQQVGFYSYGEISPYTSGHCDLHNQTMTLTTISEVA
ncbi:MAG: FIST N-terminal domain-containing protein [Thiohalobacterales bacterium]|nr:FIST N-terminal domain-containing protein [Thiohalobacterales bacterium]